MSDIIYIPTFQPNPIWNGVIFASGAFSLWVLLSLHCKNGCNKNNEKTVSCVSYIKSCNPLTREQGTNEPSRQQRLIWYCAVDTYFMIICFAMNLSFGALLMLNLHWNPVKLPATHWSFISWIYKLFVLSYDTGKFFMYYIFLIRIQIAFYGSAYEYPKKLIYILKFLIIGFILVMFTADVFFSKVTWEYVPSYESYMPQGMAPLQFLTFQLFFDPLVSVLTLYLFFKPLYSLVKLIKRPKTVDYDERTNEHYINYNRQLFRTRNLMVKLSYLTCIALLSSATLLGILVGLNAFGEFTSIDLVINVCCILLMNTKYSSIYVKVCGSCHRCMIKCCCAGDPNPKINNEKVNDGEDIELQSNTNTNNNVQSKTNSN